jgi:streptogramin lyase
VTHELYFSCCLGISYNQPNFSPNVSWNSNAATFTSYSIVGSEPYNIFVNTNNTVYVTAETRSLIIMWYEEQSIPAKNFTNETGTRGLFVTSDGDVYVEYRNVNITYRVDKWASNSTSSVAVINTTSGCYSLFIDLNNTLYCSHDSEHKVIKTSLNNNSNSTVVVAGNGTFGSLPNMLNVPNGIFVDQNFSLYVADSYNNRIQRFNQGQLNGTTVALGALTLSYPTGVILDGDGYLFIVDNGHSRIIGSGSTGFRCVVGCSGSGNQSNQLNSPRSMAFDSYGNMFVVDTSNKRVQKFLLASNISGEFDKNKMIAFSYIWIDII